MMSNGGTNALEGGGETGSQVVLRRPRAQNREKGGGGGGLVNGVIKMNRPKSEYISPSGVSTLDIRTRLRITEAELAIVQREVLDLLAERNALEASARQWEESWRFVVQECGRVVEQRDEMERRVETLEQTITASQQQTFESHKGNKKGKVSRADLEQCRLALESQTHVCETLERERDQANDDYEFAQARLHTLMQQYQDLASTCSEVARERDKAQAEVQLLREELHRYDPDADNAHFLSRDSRRHEDSASSRSRNSDTPPTSNDPQVLARQVREMAGERDHYQSLYDQALKKAEQCQKQLFRAEEDRRQALATSEALTALWQKKFEKAQNENYELRQELLSAQDRISHLRERLAMTRLQHSRARPNAVESHPRTSSSSSSNATPSYITSPHRAQSFHSSLSQGAMHIPTSYSLSQDNFAFSQGSASSGPIGIVKPTRHMSLKSPPISSSSYNIPHIPLTPHTPQTPHTPYTPHTPQTPHTPYTPHTPHTVHSQHSVFDDIHESVDHNTDEEEGSWI